MKDTLAGTCPEFREVGTAMTTGQTAWATFVFCGYAFAAFLPAILSMTLFQKAYTSPHMSGRIVLVPPVSSSTGSSSPCSGNCGRPDDVKVKGIKIDRNGLKLGIGDDPSFEMMKVLRRVHGLVAFAPPDEPRYANYLFDASGARPVGEVSTAIDDYFPLLLPDRSQWPDLVRLAEIHNIDRSEIAYALFPVQFWDVVAESLRAEAHRQELSGAIVEATIRFDATVASGVRVEKLASDSAAKSSGRSSSKLTRWVMHPSLGNVD